MTKDQVAAMLETMPMGLDADDYIMQLADKIIAWQKQQYTGLSTHQMLELEYEYGDGPAINLIMAVDDKLREINQK